MKMIIILILLSLCSIKATELNYVNYSVYSMDFKQSSDNLLRYIKSNSYKTTSQNNYSHKLKIVFEIEEEKLFEVNEFILSLGLLTKKEIHNKNQQLNLKELQIENDAKIKAIKEYKLMLTKLDSVNSDKYYPHWQKIQELEEDLLNLKKNISKIENTETIYSINIELNEEITTPESNKISFVHMPGVEYVNLFTENPTKGISDERYQGIMLKYLFTKGKSYLNIGALKSVNHNKSDTTSLQEMFCLSFGQDWYSRHFGRGKNKFFNLYIGYQIGYILPFSTKQTEGFTFINPSIGVEIFKNKYILFDSNISYFLPIHEDNQALRAWRIGTSLNFTF